ncbi:MAG: type II toxin-antitoxin system VapC family toxin [Actinomycetota bacterium]
MDEATAAGTLVDSNVLLDIFTDDPKWAEWSGKHLADALDRGPALINPIVYAEVSVGFERIEDLEDALPGGIEREDLPWEAGFLAGKCFLAYRRARGQRRSPLPDFYIGAHAAITGRALLTRDPKRYEEHFPRLTILAPDG